VAVEGEYFPTEVGYNVELQSGQDPEEDDETRGRTTSTQMSFPETVSVQTVCAAILLLCKPAGEEARCGGPGLAWLHMVCG
jgi:hypothetical protein